MAETGLSGDGGERRSGRLLRRLLRDYTRPYLWTLVAAIVCMVITAVATGAIAKIMQTVIDRVFTERAEDALVPVALAVFITFIAKGGANFGQSVLMDGVGRRVVAKLQSDMFHSVIRADLALFNRTPSGTLVTRFTNDVQALLGASSSAVTGIGRDAATLIALIITTFVLDWQLASIAFVVLPISVLPIAKLGRRMRRIAKNTQARYGIMAAGLTEVFQGMRHVKAYGAEEREMQRADAVIQRIAKLNRRAVRIRNASTPIMEGLTALALVAVIVYGGTQVIAGTKTPGAFFGFITAMLLAYEPLKRLASINVALQQGLAAAERIFAVIDQRPAIVDRPGARVLSRAAGRITFQDVHFGYSERAPALHGVSIEVPAGQSVALVGPSGAGKSSVLNLIPRFYEVGSGAVLIDGLDIRDVTMASLRAQLALVSQDVVLFDDTVRANIAYARPEATDAEIEAAARSAGAHGFITALPMGYDTPVGENGVNLSGGQRQRLSIARAMLKNAPILLLDEATSALDTATERQVQQAIRRLMAGRTTVAVAHRLSTIRDADLIYVLNEGHVVECGHHAQLVRRGGLYARLWAMQTESVPEPELAETAEADS